jgi:methylthioribose-1-phosphate isomerase
VFRRGQVAGPSRTGKRRESSHVTGAWEGESMRKQRKTLLHCDRGSLSEAPFGAAISVPHSATGASVTRR